MATIKGRAIIAEPTGAELYAQRTDHQGYYRIVDKQGEVLGYMRKHLQLRWGVSLEFAGSYEGAYADMPHAAGAILSRRFYPERWT